MIDLRTFPSEPGVYALKHLPTKRVYFGSSHNVRSRIMRWKWNLANPAKSGKRLTYFPITYVDDWEALVLQTFTHEVTREELLIAEGRWILRAFGHQNADRVINHNRTAPRALRRALGRSREKRLTVAQHVEALRE